MATANCLNHVQQILRSKKPCYGKVNVHNDSESEDDPEPESTQLSARALRCRRRDIRRNHNRRPSQSAIQTVKVKTLAASYDVTYPNKRYSKKSRNGASTTIDLNTKKVTHFATRSKGYNHPKTASTASMETQMFSQTIEDLGSLNLKPTHMSVDGQKGIPALIESINEKEDSDELSMKIHPDAAHMKKSLPDKIVNWAKVNNEALCLAGYRAGITQKWSRLLTARIWVQVFSNSEVKTLEECKARLGTSFGHYLPKDAIHSECKDGDHNWYNTAFGNGNNRSKALVRDYPTGCGNLFKKWFYSEYDDDMLLLLMSSGCTSLNESCNHVINRYSDKTRYLGPLSYRHSVARGVLQWNNPYYHYVEELQSFGIYLSPEHTKYLDKRLKERGRVSAYSVSHKRNAKEHSKKFYDGKTVDT